MKNNWNELQTNFWSKGFCIIDNLIPDNLLISWRDLVHWYSKYSEKCPGVNKVSKKFDTANLEGRDAAGEYKFTSIDGRISRQFNSLDNYYHSLSNFISLFTGLDIVESFDLQSSVTFMNYEAPGGTLVPHYDTNGITLLLYLTNNEDGGTQLQPLDTLRPTVLGYPDEVLGESIIVLPKFGRAVLFQGRKVWHSSMATIKTPKISSVWNYYINGDNWRPPEVSKRLYK